MSKCTSKCNGSPWQAIQFDCGGGCLDDEEEDPDTDIEEEEQE